MRHNPYATSDGWAFCNGRNTTEDYNFKSRETMCFGWHHSENRHEHLYMIKRPTEFMRSVLLGRIRHLRAQCADFNLMDVSLRIRIAIPFLDIAAPEENGWKQIRFHVMDGGKKERAPILDFTFNDASHGSNVPIYQSKVIEHVEVPKDNSDENHGGLWGVFFEYDADQDYFKTATGMDQLGFEIELTVFLTYNFGTAGTDFTIKPEFYEL